MNDTHAVQLVCAQCGLRWQVLASQFAYGIPCPNCMHPLQPDMVAAPMVPAPRIPAPEVHPPAPPIRLAVDVAGPLSRHDKRRDSGGAAGHYVRERLPCSPNWTHILCSFFSWKLNGELTTRLIVLQMLFALAVWTLTLMVAVTGFAPLLVLLFFGILLGQLWFVARVYREYLRHGQIVVAGVVERFPSDLQCFGYFLANAAIASLPALPLAFAFFRWLSDIRPGSPPEMPSTGTLVLLAFGALICNAWSATYFPTATNLVAVTGRLNPLAVFRVIAAIPGDLAILLCVWDVFYIVGACSSVIILAMMAPAFVTTQTQAMVLALVWNVALLGDVQYLVSVLFTANGLLLRRHAQRLGLAPAKPGVRVAETSPFQPPTQPFSGPISAHIPRGIPLSPMSPVTTSAGPVARRRVAPPRDSTLLALAIGLGVGIFLTMLAVLFFVMKDSGGGSGRSTRIVIEKARS